MNRMGFSLQNMVNPDSVIGIEIIRQDDGFIFHKALLQKEKDSLKLVNSSKSITSFEVLLEDLPKDIPLALSINTKGILTKEIKADINDDKNQLLKQILPDANIDDFMIQTIGFPNGLLVSGCRKSLAGEWVEKFDNEGHWVLGIGLGPLTVSSIKPFIRESEFDTLTHSFFFDNNHLILSHNKKIDPQNSQVLLGDERMDSYLLPAVSIAFETLMDNPSTSDYESIEHSKKEYLNMKWFKILGMGSLVFTLLLLMASFIHGDTLKNQNRELARQLSQKESELKEIELLRDRISQFGNGGGNQLSKSSLYADRLAMSIPNNIRMELLDIYPMKGEEKDYGKEDMLEYISDEILIKGISENLEDYNRWSDNLRNMEWIKDGVHLNYEDTDEGIGEFELKIIIK